MYMSDLNLIVQVENMKTHKVLAIVAIGSVHESLFQV